MDDVYRKKPVEIHARQLVASESWDAAEDLARWCGGLLGGTLEQPFLLIPTLEGDMRASRDDWIIQGVAGEFYPCKPEIFDATYER